MEETFQWFRTGKYGLFIHFGLYAIAARHEWVQTLEEISPKDYEKYMDYFNPDLLRPKEWARQAKAAGFRYVIITARHHEGFSLWDSEYSDFTITHTAYGKDLLKELVDAFREEGLGIGLYYSLLDWHREDFTVDGFHPMRNDETYCKEHPGDMGSYRQFMKNQIRELLTKYGKIDYFWFDFSYEGRKWKNSVGKGPKDWDSEGLEALVYELQPHILLNDRLGLGHGVQTPEQFARSQGAEEGQLWETVQTLNNSWGYDRDNHHYKTPEMVVKQLVDTVSKGGNFVMNVGPNARGEWGEEATEILSQVGEWLHKNGDSIYGTTPAPYTCPVDCRYTKKGKKLYLHVMSWPFRTLLLPELGGKVAFARLLADGSEIRFVDTKNLPDRRPDNDNLYQEVTTAHIDESLDPSMVMLNLPVKEPDQLLTVIELTLK